MDVSSKAKQAVLEEIMRLMDEKMGEGLKSKSPKFMRVEMEAKPLEGEEDDGEDSELMNKMREEDDMQDRGMMSEDDSDDEERLRRLYEDLA